MSIDKQSMKALMLTSYRQFSYTDVPIPVVTEHSVLVRIHSCGICGSDIHGMTGVTGRRMPPIIMGHEAAGTIESVGAQVTGWKPGDRVTFDSTVFCGECWYCRRGQINLCENRRVLGVSCDVPVAQSDQTHTLSLVLESFPSRG